MRPLVPAICAPPLALAGVLLALGLVLAPRVRRVVLVVDDPAPLPVLSLPYRCTSLWCVPDRRDVVMTGPSAAHPERIRVVVVY